MAEPSPSFESLPPKALNLILHHLYLCCISRVESLKQHYCSPSNPCRIALLALSHFFSLRLLSSSWNDAVLITCKDLGFFQRVEDAYYPHPWHINTKVRKAVLLGYYRVYHTVSSEHGRCPLVCQKFHDLIAHLFLGDRGIYYAYDFSSSAGCFSVQKVVIKAWVSASDNECVTESTTYSVFRSSPITGIPDILVNSFDPGCDVYAIVLRLLGPTLDDLRRLRLGGKLEDKMVLAVAIQMVGVCISVKGIVAHTRNLA